MENFILSHCSNLRVSTFVSESPGELVSTTTKHSADFFCRRELNSGFYLNMRCFRSQAGTSELVREVNLTLDPSTGASVTVLLRSSWGPRPAQGSFSSDLFSTLLGLLLIPDNGHLFKELCGQNLRRLYDFKFLFTQSMDTFLLTTCHSKQRFHPRALLYYPYILKIYCLVFKNLMSRQNSDRV